MTRHKATQTGLGTPSPLDRWINALLHAFAMLVSHVARRLAPKPQNPTAECDGDWGSTPEVNSILDQHQEPTSAAPNSQRNGALMVSSEQSSRPSNHEGGLASLSASHSRASEALSEHLWAARANVGFSSRRPRILGSLRSDPKGRFGPVDQIERRRPRQWPRMTRGWTHGLTATARAPS
jgi:hypothetical protein